MIPLLVLLWGCADKGEDTQGSEPSADTGDDTGSDGGSGDSGSGDSGGDDTQGGDAGGYFEGQWDDRLDAGWLQAADDLGFVLVVPGVQEGMYSPHAWGDEPIVLDHLDTLLEAAWAGSDLDRSRSWFIGQSARGHMAVYLGLYVIEPWTAIGAVSCGLGVYFDYPEPPPDVRMPFHVAHDPDDTVVEYDPYALNLLGALDANGHPYIFTEWSMGANGHSWAEGLTEALIAGLEALSP